MRARVVSCARPRRPGLRRIDNATRIANLEKVLGDAGEETPKFEWEKPKPEPVTVTDTTIVPVEPTSFNMAGFIEVISMRSAMPGFVGMAGRELMGTPVHDQLQQPLSWLAAITIMFLVTFGSMMTITDRLGDEPEEPSYFDREAEEFNGRNALIGVFYLMVGGVIFGN